MSLTEKSVEIIVNGKKHELLLSVKNAKRILEKYESFEKIGDLLLKSTNFNDKADVISSLVLLLCVDDKLTADELESTTTIVELYEFQVKILEAIRKGSLREVESETDPKKHSSSRVENGEFFTRLLYFALSKLHLTQKEFWEMPFGELLDLRECDLQYQGIKKPKRENYIDDIIPEF